MTISNLIKKSSQYLKKTSTTPLLDSEVFLCKALKKEKEFILANPNFKISAAQEKKFWDMVERRKKYEPVVYIINKKEFFGLDFYIDENVLMPRPKTEILVEKTIEIILKLFSKKNNKQIDVIDVGTGSGCIIAAIANQFSYYRRDAKYCVSTEENKINFFAIDNSKNSLKTAKKNFKKLELKKIKTLQGNLIEPYLKIKNKSSIKIITANLPYLNETEYKNCLPEVKKHEPKNALYGGKNGLKYIIELIGQIKKSEIKNVYLLLEISPAQKKYFINNFSSAKIIKDFFQADRFAILHF